MAQATATPTRPERTAPNLTRVPYLPGLDGMRALAVAAVLVYHADPNWLPGGFLGVEVFFVISGYLITLLLISERERTGRVRIGAFWARRARRLLPALFLMLFLLLTYTWVFRSSELGKLRGDLLGGVFYVSNWYQIWVGQGYSSSGDFAPLRHLWSLAVEEQFYLLWPVVMLFVLRRSSARSIAGTARWLVLAALVVTAVTALLYHPGPIGDCSVNPDAYWSFGARCISKADALYLSTISRSSGLLLGAAFAMIWRPIAIMRGPLRRRAFVLDLAAIVGLALLALFSWKIHFIDVDSADPWLFRGGFLWTSLATLLVIAAVTHSRTLIGRLLGIPPLVWAGTRSYGLYLYSWPIYQVIRKVAGNALTFPQFVVAMVATVVISELSYQWVETPIRRRQVAAWWESLRVRRDPVPRKIAAAVVVVSLLLLGVGVLQLGLAKVELNEVEAAIQAGEESVTPIDELLGGGDGADEGAAAATPSASTVPEAASTTPVESTTTTSTTTTTTTTLPTEPVSYFAIGDSVMLGAAGVLEDRGYVVSAEVSRQMKDFVPVMEQLGAADLFGDPIIIHLGTNGPFTRETLDALLAPLSNVNNVIMLNVHANRPWTAENNRILAARDKPLGQDNIILIDWNALAEECPGDCFADDGIHLSDAGQRYYANVIGDLTGR